MIAALTGCTVNKGGGVRRHIIEIPDYGCIPDSYVYECGVVNASEAVPIDEIVT